ncbi:TylF/MycF/NovP-related O-methyltransferase [Peptoanaerobacter stomatis]
MSIKIDGVIAFIDNSNQTEFFGKKVIKPAELKEKDFDAILVFTGSKATKEIYKQCLDLEFDMNKIIFVYDNFMMKDANTNYDLIEELLGKNYAMQIKNADISLGIIPYEWKEYKEYRSEFNFEDDYVRFKTLENIAEEINFRNISVQWQNLEYLQESLQDIYKFFLNRTLYLFDTFEGFSEEESNKEIARGYISQSLKNILKDTSINKVLEYISDGEKYDNIVVKKGLFPESLDGLEDKFAFVSLDVDLEYSTFEGLKYFYPRMVKGGGNIYS